MATYPDPAPRANKSVDPPGDTAERRKANVRTALGLLLVALTFFFGVIVSKFMGGYEVGMSIVGFAIFVFLVLTIGRNIRGGK